MIIIIVQLISILLSTLPARTLSAGTPHIHDGVIPPYTPTPPSVEITADVLAILESGKPYKTQVKGDGGGRGLVVVDVNAKEGIVWETILDFPKYVGRVKHTTKSDVYVTDDDVALKKKNKNDSNDSHHELIFVEMACKILFVSLSFFVRHEHHVSKKILTWTLDYGRQSTISDSVGYWHTKRLSEDKTRLYYSVQVKLMDWVPGAVVDIMSKQALVEATGWVKKYSEEAMLERYDGGDGADAGTAAAVKDNENENDYAKGAGGDVKKSSKKVNALSGIKNYARRAIVKVAYFHNPEDSPDYDAHVASGNRHDSPSSSSSSSYSSDDAQQAKSAAGAKWSVKEVILCVLLAASVVSNVVGEVDRRRRGGKRGERKGE